MNRNDPISRRRLLGAGALAMGGLALSGCDRLNGAGGFRDVLKGAEGLTMRAQRLLVGREALAREFSENEMSPVFRANGNREVADSAYNAHVRSGFAGWTLAVDGHVRRPLALTLDAFADIGHHAAHAQRLAIGIQIKRGQRLQLEQLAVLGLYLIMHGVQTPWLGEELPVLRGEALLIALWQMTKQFVVDVVERLCGQAMQLRGTRRGKQLATGYVPFPGAQASGFEGQFETLLAIA